MFNLCSNACKILRNNIVKTLSSVKFAGNETGIGNTQFSQHSALHSLLARKNNNAQMLRRASYFVPTQVHECLLASNKTDLLKNCIGRNTGQMDNLLTRQTARAASQCCNCSANV